MGQEASIRMRLDLEAVKGKMRAESEAWPAARSSVAEAHGCIMVAGYNAPLGQMPGRITCFAAEVDWEFSGSRPALPHNRSAVIGLDPSAFPVCAELTALDKKDPIQGRSHAPLRQTPGGHSACRGALFFPASTDRAASVSSGSRLNVIASTSQRLAATPSP